MIDCILGYHLNPLSCGIAKFNRALGRALNVPVLSLFDPSISENPLLSIKISEFTLSHIPDLERFIESRAFHLFLHDFESSPIEARMVARARTVYAGNIELAARLRRIRPDIVEAWCPGALEADPFVETELSVFTFGMAHKVRGEHYRKLDRLLAETGKTYSLYLSTAVHEGMSLDDSALENIRSAFSGPVHFLGFLSDSAVLHYLKNTTYFAAFFPKGVRANNTSVHSAMSAGAVVVTNVDGDSPYLNVIDIAKCNSLPIDNLDEIRQGAIREAELFGWGALAKKIGGQK